ncbi:dTDP-4-dehydrorhamnose reductase [Streptomyces sp. KhCrAH-43]|uniref:sugar nucleotide-binding protein n=1 Tax=unclassified Streptomyces TaxID=2593676 RepID=UPI00036E37A6|nr:sugar nucleotide-binding protein [Streptomyces sp. KhCrAH-43]MYS33628.1 sugar nucleotide-binding protein [Streptomyces sp. SID4920]MYX63779.1 sugar nucleotide-binding protein [Streptomyces sp. SID8373]RAJ52869.1 dTDP-4-dehydrorhamnose reductase [Streptomyces sp. KhCrAH-43]
MTAVLPVSSDRVGRQRHQAGVLAVHPAAVVARPSLILGHGRSEHERLMHDLADGTVDGALFTDDVRCPVHVADLASALLEVAESDAAGIHHLGGADAVSRYELGVLVAERDGLDASRLPAGSRVESAVPGPLDVRLDSQATQRQLRTRLRGARNFVRPGA